MLWMESICGLRQMFLGTSATWGRKAAKSSSQWVIFRSLFSLSEVTSQVSDWCSAQSLESLDCLPVFQKESIKVKRLLVKTLLLQEKSPNQFWLTQIICTVRMCVINSFTNMVKEKKKGRILRCFRNIKRYWSILHENLCKYITCCSLWEEGLIKFLQF